MIFDHTYNRIDADKYRHKNKHKLLTNSKMGKTYRRNQSFKPKGKDFKRFKQSNKFKKWDEKPQHSLKTSEEPGIVEE